MKIAFVHYHLKPGGVTTVLKQQTKIVQQSGSALVLSGESPESGFTADTTIISGLNYDKEGKRLNSPKQIAQAMLEAIFSKWKDGCDLLHIHNPILAKNRDFLKIVRELQKSSIPLFLQIHDFAENGRPLFYFKDEYPADCHYGVINSRDYEILLEAGLKKEGVHKIFNSITAFNSRQSSANLENYVLYPVRAIRRKNIGEAIFLSLFFKKGETLVFTLPPNSPVDKKSYVDWKCLVQERKLKVVFEAGLREEFSSLLNSAKFLITTSITEGFGFAFLEPWIAGKMLCGRLLPEICQDLISFGMQLDHLYHRLQTPLAWVDKEKFYKKWSSSILQSCERFDYRVKEEQITRSFKAITAGDTVDFGLLDEVFQKSIISRVMAHEASKEQLIRLNPILSQLGQVTDREKLVLNNRKVVVRHYQGDVYGKKLMDIYRSIIKTPVQQKINKKILLASFLDLEKFSLLKWSQYA